MALEARGVARRFSSVTVVRDINLRVDFGQVVGYLGPNGSGKTVTARMLTGLLEPTAGQILYDGRDIQEDLVAFHQRLGYVPEEPHLYSFLSGREHLELVGRLRRLPGSLLTRKISALLELLGLARAADQPISGYSKGMKQKILIIAALLHDPDLLIFDEPESGLDLTAGLVLRHLVPALAARGKAILYSSHVLDAVEKLCSRVIIIHRGSILANAPVEELRGMLESTSSLEDVIAQLVETEDPGRTARDIAEVAALRA